MSLCFYVVIGPTDSDFHPHLTSFPQPGLLQATPRKSSIFRPTPQTLKNQKKWAQGTQKPAKKTPKSRLDINQFAKYVKKWNLTKTIVFTMFSAHPTTDPGTIFSPKPTKKHTSELTLKIDNLKPRRNKKMLKNDSRQVWGNPLKIIQNPTLDPKLSPLVLLATPQPPTGDQRSRKQVPMS